MSEKELKRLKVIHKVLEKRIKQKDAAKLLFLFTRQVRRIQKKVKEKGDTAVVHRNRDRPSSRKFSNKFKNEVIDTVKKNYYKFEPKFASEKLYNKESKKVSKETLRKWMIEEGILIPRKLRNKTDVHPWRKLKDCFGEMLLTDGSIHDWLEGRGPNYKKDKFKNLETSC